ncbi:MAG TPA: VWA domain-containing protein [Candidatus Eremiobacteraeota bacterium]|nr:MAG: hypothetical protein BWY64_01565 [bacterium ADurb.Bin363]HPZ06523.1 VWA domain-containing protein [Candidatus Eremiobacteraeota bacterium]
MAEEKGYTIPSNLTAKEFGKVNVVPSGKELEIDFTILMEPQGKESEGWQTGVALDGSSSMRNWYGQTLEGNIPPYVIDEYRKKGWIQDQVTDGGPVIGIKQDAYNDAVQKEYLHYSKNIVEPLAREFISYLAGNLDADGGTTVIYWACAGGDEIEVLGDFTEEQCLTLDIKGPKTVGSHTILKPAVNYFVDRFTDASRAMYIFITDGRIDDLGDVKTYTIQLARDISAGKRNPVKCILIGVGDYIDEGQMIELDNLDTGTDVDIWDHKIAKEMRVLVEIFSEVVSENQIVAPTGQIFDSNGSLLKRFSDGLPAKVSFNMPVSSKYFELEVAGQRIRQEIVKGER